VDGDGAAFLAAVKVPAPDAKRKSEPQPQRSGGQGRRVEETRK